MEKIDEIMDNGVEILVCSKHQLEYCPYCCLDFSEMNDDRRNEFKIEMAIKKFDVNNEDTGTGYLKRELL